MVYGLCSETEKYENSSYIISRDVGCIIYDGY